MSLISLDIKLQILLTAGPQLRCCLSPMQVEEIKQVF